MRTFVGRAGDARTGIYREEDDAEIRWYVRKNATQPVVTFSKEHQDIYIDDLGWPTRATTAGMNAAGRELGFAVYRDRGELRLYLYGYGPMSAFTFAPLDGRCRGRLQNIIRKASA